MSGNVSTEESGFVVEEVVRVCGLQRRQDMEHVQEHLNHVVGAEVCRRMEAGQVECVVMWRTVERRLEAVYAGQPMDEEVRLRMECVPVRGLLPELLRMVRTTRDEDGVTAVSMDRLVMLFRGPLLGWLAGKKEKSPEEWALWRGLGGGPPLRKGYESWVR